MAIVCVVETELKLSDAFIFPDEKYNVQNNEFWVEIKVKIVNTNSCKKTKFKRTS